MPRHYINVVGMSSVTSAKFYLFYSPRPGKSVFGLLVRTPQCLTLWQKWLTKMSVLCL